MNKEKQLRMVDKLDGVNKEAYEFIQKNASNFEPLSGFTTTISLFAFDTTYKHPQKQVFVHHENEWDTRASVWRPCERTISFQKSDKSLSISVFSKVEGKSWTFEQALILKEDRIGKWSGMLSRLAENDEYEFFTFGIGKNGKIKPKTTNFTTVANEKTKSDLGKS